jgi:penicillin G amidase
MSFMSTETLSRKPARGRLVGQIFLGILVAVLVLAFVAWFGGRWYLARSVAEYDSERQVAGLQRPVEVTFDAMGIPHVWAETDADAYFTLGWLHAAERLFQMETALRMASGTLSEVFGEAAFETDLRQRRIGFRRVAEGVEADLDPRSRALIEAYRDGINARIDGARLLPPEFVVLRFRPRHWTVLDVMTLFVYQSWYPTELADQSDRHARLVAGLGPEVAEMLAAPKPWTIPSVPEGFLAEVFANEPFPMRMTTATNNWALAPGRSASGHALHAADPHLAVDAVPGFWYIVRVHSQEGTDVLGITFPGVPVIAMGHNGRAAWSFSVAPLVLTDHFLESFHPEDSLQVRTPDGYAPLQVMYEDIAVSGEEEARRVPIYLTPRGVLMERGLDTGLSMHWSGYDLMHADGVAAALRFPDVEDFETFRREVTTLASFSANWIYSDRTGTIGYQLGPAVPRRTYNPFLRQDAADPEARWEGYHDFATTPWAANPAQGWLATTNNPPAPVDWPFEIPGTYNHMRIERVRAWMETAATFDRSDMERMQMDYASHAALQFRELMAEGAERAEGPELAARLRAWDGRMAPEDTLATVFSYWWRAMTRNLYEESLGASWYDAFPLREMVLFEDLAAHDGEGHSEYVVEASARSIAEAVSRAGGRPLGALQQLTKRHPLSRAPLLDRWLGLNRGPFARGGHTESLNMHAAAYRRHTDRFEVQVAPSMRYILDWADVDGFTIEIPLGQSGNPFSPHYDDFLALNDRGERWVVPFSRDAVEARAASRLRLVP